MWLKGVNRLRRQWVGEGGKEGNKRMRSQDNPGGESVAFADNKGL